MRAHLAWVDAVLVQIGTEALLADLQADAGRAAELGKADELGDHLVVPFLVIAGCGQAASSGLGRSAERREANGASSTPRLQPTPTRATYCRARPETRWRRYMDLPDSVAQSVNWCRTVR